MLSASSKTKDLVLVRLEDGVTYSDIEPELERAKMRKTLFIQAYGFVIGTMPPEGESVLNQLKESNKIKGFRYTEQSLIQEQ